MKIHENPVFQKLIEEVDGPAFISLSTEIKLEKINHLQTLSVQYYDPFLKTVALYYLADISYDTGAFDECMRYLNDCIQLAKEENLTFYMMRCYNLLAIIDSENADYDASISNYLKAFHISEIHPEYRYSCIILNNIGNLFVWLKEYEVAIDYLINAYHKYFDEANGEQQIIALINMNIVEMYSVLKQYDKVNEWINTETMRNKEAINEIQDLLDINNIARLYYDGELQKAAEVANHVLTSIKGHDVIYLYRGYLRILEYALEAEDEKTAKQVIPYLDKIRQGSEVTTFEYDYAVLRHRYYELFMREHDDGTYAKELLKEYVKNADHVINELRNTYTRRLIVETKLLKAEKEKEVVLNDNRKLQKDIELDYFTHILNKNSMEKYINNELTNKASAAKHALLLIDIDHFKDVNDTYGHNRGDDLLLKTVEMITSCCSKNMLFGRFGGDEFLLFVKNIRTIEYIQVFAEELLKKAHRIIVSDNKHITLSIGIHITKEDNFKDAFENTDKALYEAKRNGRDGYAFSNKN